ncbi:MAG: DUF2029 domain-containing protein [Candidatus Latescibacterota bacterium]|nr:MAG: DUF2029 domain-containing protein [Candidatus Latescibacterota bacterium]
MQINNLKRLLLLVVLAIGIHAVFWLSLHYGWLDPLFNDSTHRLPRGVDFYSVYQKSYDLSVGKSLYTDVGSGPEGSRYLVVPYCAPHYRYLPSWGWFVSQTFVRLPATHAYWIWVVLCELMLVTCLVMFLRKTADLKKRMLLICLWLCYTPFYLELFLGQFTFMATGLIALALLAFDNRHDWRGTLWLALSVLLKYVGVVILIPLVVFGRFRHALAVVAGIIAVCAIYFVPHPDDWSLFVGVARYGTDNPIHAGNLGLQGLLGNLVRLVPNQESSLAAALGFLLLKAIPALIVILVSFLTWRYRSQKNFITVCLLWLTCYFLAGTDVFEHHYVLLLPVFSFAFLRSGSPWLIVIWAWIALPTIFNIVDSPGLPTQRYFEVEDIWWRDGQYVRVFLYHLWKIAPTTGLFVWLVRAIRHDSMDKLQEDTGQPGNGSYV